MKEARVKQNWQGNTVMAHAGREYIKSEWRAVPDDDHVSVLLDYREPGVKPELEPDAMTEPPPKPPVKKRTVRKRATKAKGS